MVTEAPEQKAATQTPSVAMVCPAHSGVVEKLDSIHGLVKAISDRVERLAGRPPVWATIVISILTTMLGVSVGVACAIAKNGGP